MSNELQEEPFFEPIGERFVWGEYQPFALSYSDRKQHVYVLGKSGTGKTSLLKNLIAEDLEAGRGVALVDPHGDLAHELLESIPTWRFDDVVYFRPGDAECPIGLNLFDKVDPEKRHVVASNIVGAFKSIWKNSWGPRMEYILFATVSALLEAPGTTLLGIQRMFVDSAFRDWVVGNVRDPMVRSFWLDEYAKWDSRFRNEVVAPIQNKIGQLLMTPVMRNVLGQVRRKIDFRFMMDTKRIFIANLQKSEIGEDKANLLGSLIVAGMQHAASDRAHMDAKERVPFTCFIDEFQNFQTDSFASILSESRKYGLALVLSHQFSSQLAPEIQDAVFGNVGTVISFRVGFSDAERLSQEFGGSFPPSEFANLSNYHICARMLTAGQVSEPFLGRTLPPRQRLHGKSQTVVNRSREKYGVRREVVEGKIKKWYSK